MNPVRALDPAPFPAPNLGWWRRFSDHPFWPAALVMGVMLAVAAAVFWQAEPMIVVLVPDGIQQDAIRAITYAFSHTGKPVEVVTYLSLFPDEKPPLDELERADVVVLGAEWLKDEEVTRRLSPLQVNLSAAEYGETAVAGISEGRLLGVPFIADRKLVCRRLDEPFNAGQRRPGHALRPECDANLIRRQRMDEAAAFVQCGGEFRGDVHIWASYANAVEDAMLTLKYNRAGQADGMWVAQQRADGKRLLHCDIELGSAPRVWLLSVRSGTRRARQAAAFIKFATDLQQQKLLVRMGAPTPLRSAIPADGEKENLATWADAYRSVQIASAQDAPGRQ